MIHFQLHCENHRATRVIFITFLGFFRFAAKQLAFPIVSSSIVSADDSSLSHSLIFLLKPLVLPSWPLFADLRNSCSAQVNPQLFLLETRGISILLSYMKYVFKKVEDNLLRLAMKIMKKQHFAVMSIHDFSDISGDRRHENKLLNVSFSSNYEHFIWRMLKLF